MKLLKLVYLAHGWNLGFTSEPLISEQVQAWQWGPVIPALYHEIKEYKDRPIPADVIPAPEMLEPDIVTPLLDAIWNAYSKFSGAQLSTITHEPGSPWFKVWNEQDGRNKRGAIIPNSLIEEYYKERTTSGKKTESATA